MKAGDSVAAPSLDILAARLGHRFARAELLREALTHPSIAATAATRSYERLEFLGDRVAVAGYAESRRHQEIPQFPDLETRRANKSSRRFT